MSTRWPVKALDDLLNVQNGYAFSSKRFAPAGGMPLIRIRDLKDGTSTEATFTGDYDSKYEVRRGDLLIGMDGDFACHRWEGPSALLNQRVCRLQDFSDELLPDFLFHGINRCLKEIEDRTTFTTVKHLSAKKVKAIQMPIPPIAEQQRIVAILDEAFAGIQAAVANAEKNLANAREVFENYLKAIFLNGGEEWESRSIGEVCVLKSGTTVNKMLESPSGDVPYIKVADLNLPGNEKRVTTSSRFRSDPSRTAVFPVGTTVFPKRGGAILTNKKRITDVPLCADLNIMGVIPGDDLVPEFLFYYFVGVDMRELGSGSSIPQINNYDIEPLPISFPPGLAEQQDIVRRLDDLSVSCRQLATCYDRQLTVLSELKQSILQKAFSGELTAKEAEKEMAAA